MSDPYTHPKYDDWKLATPWDDEDDEDLATCDQCEQPFSEDDLYDGLCGGCEMEVIYQETEDEERSRDIFCIVCLMPTPSSGECCGYCRTSRK